jgi:hypothetical protein
MVNVTRQDESVLVWELTNQSLTAGDDDNIAARGVGYFGGIPHRDRLLGYLLRLFCKHHLFEIWFAIIQSNVGHLEWTALSLSPKLGYLQVRSDQWEYPLFEFI